MLRFVIDEDIPRSTGIALEEHGYDVIIFEIMDLGDQRTRRFINLRKEKKQ